MKQTMNMAGLVDPQNPQILEIQKIPKNPQNLQNLQYEANNVLAGLVDFNPKMGL